MKIQLLLIVTLSFTLFPLTAQELKWGPETEEWELLYKPAYKTVQEIPVKDGLRKELFDLLRPKLEKTAKEPLLFQGELVAFRNWALFQGSSLDKNQRPFQYPDLGTSDTVALWLRTFDGWTLVDYSGGHSDVFYIVWPEMYGMPQELL